MHLAIYSYNINTRSIFVNGNSLFQAFKCTHDVRHWRILHKKSEASDFSLYKSCYTFSHHTFTIGNVTTNFSGPIKLFSIFDFDRSTLSSVYIRAVSRCYVTRKEESVTCAGIDPRADRKYNETDKRKTIIQHKCVIFAFSAKARANVITISEIRK